MQDKDRFRIDEPRVIGELMEGELVLVQFESGRYFSVRGVGVDVCQLLAAGRTVGETAAQLATHFGVAEATVHADVRSFVAALSTERVLVPTEAGDDAGTAKIAAKCYEAPTFEKFDDMADQLLLDPIHEIDETGWPIRKTG